MSVRATETATVLALGRADFTALLARRDTSSFRLKRRLASLFTAHLRNQLSHLAASLGDGTAGPPAADAATDRKSTRLNSSHTVISYAVFCLKKKKKKKTKTRKRKTK